MNTDFRLDFPRTVSASTSRASRSIRSRSCLISVQQLRIMKDTRCSRTGSGSLIRFEDLTSALTLSGKLYGPDFSYQDVQVPHSQTLRMPVFGVVENYYSEQTRTEIDADGNVNFITDRDETDRGHFVIIEDGESLASITSEHGANATHRFNSAYTTFTPRPKDTYSLTNAISVNEDATWTVVSKRKYTGSIYAPCIQLNDPKNEELCKQTKFYES